MIFLVQKQGTLRCVYCGFSCMRDLLCYTVHISLYIVYKGESFVCIWIYSRNEPILLEIKSCRHILVLYPCYYHDSGVQYTVQLLSAKYCRLYLNNRYIQNTNGVLILLNSLCIVLEATVWIQQQTTVISWKFDPGQDVCLHPAGFLGSTTPADILETWEYNA